MEALRILAFGRTIFKRKCGSETLFFVLILYPMVIAQQQSCDTVPLCESFKKTNYKEYLKSLNFTLTGKAA
jgi:hypothetical protein